jgi:hypothetical protein
MKGSEWRKWDLHIHSPYSNGTSNRYGATSIQQFCDKILENGIAAIGLTNYFYINKKELIEITEYLKGKCLVIPNFEFRASDKNNKGQHVNFHVLFNPCLKFENIVSSLGRIKLHNHSDKYCCENDIKEVGLDSACVDFETVIKQLETDYRVIDDFIILTPYAGYGGFKNDEKPRNTLTERKFDLYSHAILGNNQYREYFLSDREYLIADKRQSLTRKKPVIQCSDAHAFDEINRAVTWIKGDPTFEGLKQIIFEPEHRVRIQREKPDFKEDKLIIDQVRFISSNNKFTNQPVYLNDNLNVIIGGKSSGKSILLYSIAKTLLADREFFKKESIESKYDFRIEDPNFNFEIKTKGGFTQLMYRNESDNSIIPEVKYIPQNYLVKLAESQLTKSGNTLNKIVRDLINEESESMTLYEDFISKLKAADKKRESLIDTYFDIQNRISQLEAQLKVKTNKDILEANITSNTAKVELLNQTIGMTPEQILKYNSLRSELETSTQRRTEASNDYKKITDFNREILSTLTALKDKKDLVEKNLENQELKEFFSENYKALDSLITTLDKFNSNFATTKNEHGISVLNIDGPVSQLFRDMRLLNDKIKEELEPFVTNEDTKKQIETLAKSISEDREALQAINQLSREINDNKDALTDKKQQLFSLYEENYQYYIQVIDELKKRTIALEKDGLKIEGIPAFNFDKFRKSVVIFSDGRTASYSTYRICNPGNDSTIRYNLDDILADLKNMFAAIVESKTYALSSKADVKNVIKMLLEDYFFDYWQIEFKNDKLGKMSTGKASFVILMLIVGLSKSKSPILIDQPEDNLDNRSITSDLVEYLKSKKLERQIILVTHNANIVVNADAENIIVAHQKGQGDTETNSPFEFEYINGPLENTFAPITTEKNLLKSMGIREHIADIVEGGKIAFQKREEKYGFKRFSN